MVNAIVIRVGWGQRMDEIEDSVGAGGVNHASDVRIVQQLLNQHMLALGLPLLIVDNDAGDNTIKGIREYQRQVVGLARPDGRIDPGGRTWRLLDSGAGVPAPAPATRESSSLSGKSWWHANQARYPNSAMLADLASPFRE
ncbi:MAG: peptidoglycan-binding domain-containing protein, partial [Allosphingosinicella sp.]